MKKKATTSSSNRASFESLQEAKESVDQSFEELLKQLDEFYKTIDPFFNGVFFGPRHGQIISLRIDPDSIETKKTVLENSKARLHKLDQAILQSCSNICLFDPFNENAKFFLWLSEHQEKWIRYLQAILDQFLDKQKKGAEDLIYILPPGRILPTEIKERAEHVRKTIVRGLPGFLAYQKSTDPLPRVDVKANSTKRRTKEAIQREKDYLYLLDQYEKWQAKSKEQKGRKRFGPKDWLSDYKRWTSKSQSLFDKYSERGADKPWSKADDDESIVGIIKYAQRLRNNSLKKGS